MLIRQGLGCTTTHLQIDPEGRFVIVRGALMSTKVTLVTVYSPNVDDPQFFLTVWAKVFAAGEDTVIWGGDFNVTLNNVSDRVGAARCPHIRAAQQLNIIILDHNLIDIWRSRNPAAREGICVTSHHSAWSRLDCCLVTGDIASWTIDVLHLPRTLSDHAPVALCWTIPQTMPRAFSWRLPPHALLESAFKEEIRTEITQFFSTNEGSVDSPSTLWETFKAVIRGACISKQAGVLQSITTTLSNLEKEIRASELMFYQSGVPTHLAFMREKISEFEEEAVRETRFLGKDAKARNYGEGDGPGRTLATTLK